MFAITSRLFVCRICDLIQKVKRSSSPGWAVNRSERSAAWPEVPAGRSTRRYFDPAGGAGAGTAGSNGLSKDSRYHLASAADSSYHGLVLPDSKSFSGSWRSGCQSIDAAPRANEQTQAAKAKRDVCILQAGKRSIQSGHSTHHSSPLCCVKCINRQEGCLVDTIKPAATR